jgi:AcrR family transcriptional regulator
MSGNTQREEKKRQILQASLEVFAQKGYSPTVLDDVAARANIAKGTLYLYFKDKEDLYINTVLHFFDLLEAEIRDNLRPDMDPVELLCSVAASQLKFFIHHKNYIRFSITSLNAGSTAFRKKFHEPMQARMLKQFDSLTAIFDRGKSEGLFRSDIPAEDMIHAYVGMLNEATRTACMFEPEREIDVEQTIDRIMRILTEGIVSAKEGSQS